MKILQAAAKFALTWAEIKVLQIRRPVFGASAILFNTSSDKVLQGRSYQATQMCKLIDDLIVKKQLALKAQEGFLRLEILNAKK